MSSVSPAATSAPASPKRIQLNTLTGVRGVAGLIVFVTHAGLEPVYRHAGIGTNITKYAFGLGEASVSFFFMLSGFVLVWASRPTDTKRSFYRRRFVKIYPNTTVTWTVGLLLMIIAGEFTSIWNVLPALFLIHVWIPVEGVIAGVDGPAWSLACEAFFYALFPFMLIRIRRIEARRLWRWVAGLFLVLLAITVVAGLFLPGEPRSELNDISIVQGYFLLFFPPVRLIDFVIGMVLARIVIEGLMPQIRWSWVVLSLLAGWAIGLALPAPLGFVVPIIVANVLLVGKAASIDLQGQRHVFNRRGLVWLGDLSFAFYLIHWMVLHFGREAFGGGPWSTPVAFLFVAGAFLLTLGLAHLLHYRVELPAMRRWARPKRKPVPEPVPLADSAITPTGANAAVE